MLQDCTKSHTFHVNLRFMLLNAFLKLFFSLGEIPTTNYMWCISICHLLVFHNATARMEMSHFKMFLTKEDKVSGGI